MGKSITKFAYFDFLQRCMHDDRKQGIKFDALTIRVLEAIALGEHNGKPLTVTAAMNLGEIASPATLHRRIDKLAAGDWVVRRHLDYTPRFKYLFLTAKARRYFDRRSKLIRAN